MDRAAVGDRDVLVRVRATTLNRTDCGLRAAKLLIYIPCPLRGRRSDATVLDIAMIQRNPNTSLCIRIEAEPGRA